jgi:hypothetical protein
MKTNQMLLCFILSLLSTTVIKTESVESVSYSLAKTHTNQFYIENQGGFKEPEYVSKLPKRQQIRGRATSPDEIPSPSDYYDGSTNMKSQVTECSQWTTQKEACKSQGACGWCGASSACVPGNASGPKLPCLRGTYEFQEPKQNWNPLETDDISVSRSVVGGMQVTRMIPKLG